MVIPGTVQRVQRLQDDGAPGEQAEHLLLSVNAVYSPGALTTIPGAVQRVERLHDDGPPVDQGEQLLSCC